jgi:hypothetical protein
MSATARLVRILTYAAPVVLATWIVLGFVVGWGSTAAVAALLVAAACVIGVVAYVMALKRNETLYRREIAAGLDAALDAASREERDFDLATDRLVVFSDQHKGVRDGADDFWRAERAYCSALGYYFELGHRLVVLGDAEELWETWSPAKVIGKHSGSGNRALDLEARFQAADRYDRAWGNHDLNWSNPAQVAKHLVAGGPFPEGFEVREGIRLRVLSSGRELGRLFLVHGHQGTADSQVITLVSRPIVRLFGFLQRRFKKGWNTPSTDWKLRDRHDRAMFAWAKSKRSNGVILIAGHTHRPVFWDRQRRPPTDREIETLAGELREAEKTDQSDRVRAEGAADLAYAEADKRWGEGSGGPPPEDMIPPSYFNTGCCSFADGDATGLEVEGGEIRLVRWPDNEGRARPQRLASASLEDVFDAIRRHGE